MKTLIAIAALLLAVITLPAQTSFSGYYSLKHPEWPPAPVPPNSVMQIIEADGVLYMDDYDFNYPSDIRDRILSHGTSRTSSRTTSFDLPGGFEIGTNTIVEPDPLYRITVRGLPCPNTNDTSNGHPLTGAPISWNVVCSNNLHHSWADWYVEAEICPKDVVMAMYLSNCVEHATWPTLEVKERYTNSLGWHTNLVTVYETNGITYDGWTVREGGINNTNGDITVNGSGVVTTWGRQGNYTPLPVTFPFAWHTNIFPNFPYNHPTNSPAKPPWLLPFPDGLPYGGPCPHDGHFSIFGLNILCFRCLGLPNTYTQFAPGGNFTRMPCNAGSGFGGGDDAYSADTNLYYTLCFSGMPYFTYGIEMAANVEGPYNSVPGVVAGFSTTQTATNTFYTPIWTTNVVMIPAARTLVYIPLGTNVTKAFFRIIQLDP